MTIDWKPVSKPAMIGGSLAAAAFMAYAAFQKSGFLLLDYVNLPIHEAGHLIFGLFGPTLAVWGGTLLQLIFPVLFAVYFGRRGDTAGTAFSVFWLGESLVYSSVYIGDARAMVLPLVGGGEHDWNIILSKLGALRSDRDIADVVLFLGWTAMVLAVFWFVKRGRERRGNMRISTPRTPANG